MNYDKKNIKIKRKVWIDIDFLEFKRRVETIVGICYNLKKSVCIKKERMGYEQSKF